MAERMLDANVRGAREEAAGVLEHPMRPPAEQMAPLQENVAAAQAATRDALESGQRARELVAPTRNEQRKAEDRGLIIEVAGQAGVTLTEERAEEIRSSAWRAADRVAQSQEVRGQAVQAGQDEANFGGNTQTVRDSMGRVIGDAAAEAAYQVLKAELQQEGLSGQTLEDAAHAAAERAGSRETRDAGAWTRDHTSGIISGRDAAWNAPVQPPPSQRTTAQLQPVQPVEQQPEESETGASQVVISFNNNVNLTALGPTLNALGRYEEGRVALHSGEGGFSREEILRKTGLDITGTTNIVFNLQKMVDDGVITQEQLNNATNFYFTKDGQPKDTYYNLAISLSTVVEMACNAARSRGVQHNPEEYVFIPGHENVDTTTTVNAMMFIESVRGELVDISENRERSGERRQMNMELQERKTVLTETIQECNNTLMSLAGRAPNETATITMPGGAERNGTAAELRAGLEERKNAAQSELNEISLLLSPTNVIAAPSIQTGFG